MQPKASRTEKLSAQKQVEGDMLKYFSWSFQWVMALSLGLLVLAQSLHAQSVSFVARRDFGVGLSPLSVAVGDFNGDGYQDLAVANNSSRDVSVLVGNGDGDFQAAVNFPSGEWLTNSVSIGDFNGDGYQDLALTNNGNRPDLGGTVSILVGNGDGTFQAPMVLDAGVGPFSSAVGDFNCDGNQDLAVAGSFEYDGGGIINNVSVLLGNGDGTFQPRVSFEAGDGNSFVAVGDFNGDGYQDLAVTNYSSNNVSVLLGNGDGTF